ncbi:cysteine synthase family protein [Streptomyces huasconensis]|uniref:Cysteine synthase family protein n=1 Tax=Streptomyces huasconensis TaxID=1854574 RepID=A0ABV3LYW1_9ACTN
MRADRTVPHPPTPLLPVRVPLPGRSLRLWLKLESLGPYGSIKARTAEALLDALEEAGRLRPGNRVVESTSGNLGIALAGLCASRGYRCTLVVEPSTPRASVALMTEYGADVVTVPEQPSGRTLDARLAAVHDILRRDGTAVWTDQYGSSANPRVHTTGTAVELAGAAPDAGFDTVAVAVSTGGTLAGVADYFRAHRPTTRIIAVDAVGSAALGGAAAHRPDKLAGFGSGRASRFVARHHWDRRVRIRDLDAVAACARIRDRTGLSLGGSAGASVLAAVMDAAGRPATADAACLCPDGGDKYPQLTGVVARDPAGATAEVAAALDALGHTRRDAFAHPGTSPVTEGVAKP